MRRGRGQGGGKEGVGEKTEWGETPRPIFIGT